MRLGLPAHAILAAKAGATYAGPFAGRVDDYIREQLGMKRGVHFQKPDYFDFNLMQRLAEYNLSRVISSKDSDSLSKLYLDEEIVSAAKLGKRIQDQDHRLYVLKQMIQHYKTLEGIKAFTADIVPSYAELFQEMISEGLSL